MKVRTEFSWLFNKIEEDWGSLLIGTLFNLIDFSTSPILSQLFLTYSEEFKTLLNNNF